MPRFLSEENYRFLPPEEGEDHIASQMRHDQEVDQANVLRGSEEAASNIREGYRGLQDGIKSGFDNYYRSKDSARADRAEDRQGKALEDQLKTSESGRELTAQQIAESKQRGDFAGYEHGRQVKHDQFSDEVVDDQGHGIPVPQQAQTEESYMQGLPTAPKQAPAYTGPTAQPQTGVPRWQYEAQQDRSLGVQKTQAEIAASQASTSASKASAATSQLNAQLLQRQIQATDLGTKVTAGTNALSAAYQYNDPKLEAAAIDNMRKQGLNDVTIASIQSDARRKATESTAAAGLMDRSRPGVGSAVETGDKLAKRSVQLDQMLDALTQYRNANAITESDKAGSAQTKFENILKTDPELAPSLSEVDGMPINTAGMRSTRMQNVTDRVAQKLETDLQVLEEQNRTRKSPDVAEQIKITRTKLDALKSGAGAMRSKQINEGLRKSREQQNRSRLNGEAGGPASAGGGAFRQGVNLRGTEAQFTKGNQ